MLSCFAGYTRNSPWEKVKLGRSCDHLLWASTGDAETRTSGAAEAAEERTFSAGHGRSRGCRLQSAEC